MERARDLRTFGFLGSIWAGGFWGIGFLVGLGNLDSGKSYVHQDWRVQTIPGKEGPGFFIMSKIDSGAMLFPTKNMFLDMFFFFGFRADHVVFGAMLYKPCKKALRKKIYATDAMKRCLGGHENMANVDPGNAYLLEYPPTMQPPAENKANLTSPFGPTSDPVVQAILSQPLRELESWVRGCPRSDLNHQGRRKFRYERSKQTRVAPMMLVHSKGTSTPQNAKSKVNWGRFVWDFFGGEVSSSEKSSIGGFGNLKTKLAMVPWRNWMVQWLKGLGF